MPGLPEIIVPSLKVNLADPVNWLHPLNLGRVAWYKILNVPGYRGGLTLHDLVRGSHSPSDGTLTGTTKPAWGGSRGLLGSQGTLLSSNGHVSVADGNFLFTSQMSLFCSVNFTSYSGTPFIAAARTISFAAWGLYVTSAGTPSFESRTTGGNSDKSGTVGAVPLGVWCRLGVTYNLGVINWYVNGQSAGTQTIIASPTLKTDGSGTTLLSTGASQVVNGSTDSMSFWNRALSAREAALDYAQSRLGDASLLNYIGGYDYSYGATSSTFNVSVSETASAVDTVANNATFAASVSESASAVDSPVLATTVSVTVAETRQVAVTTGKVDIVNQSSQAGFNAYPWVCVLKNQTGSNANRNGYAICPLMTAGNGNVGGDAKMTQAVSTDNGATWTKTILISPSAGNGASPLSACELPDGTLLMGFRLGPNAQLGAATGPNYVAKSTDGGVTWSNLDGAGGRVPVYFDTDQQMYGRIRQDTSNGDLIMPFYGDDSGFGRGYVIALKCPAASDPTVGANWVPWHGTVAASVIFKSTFANFNETSILQTSATNWVAVARSDGADQLAIAFTTNSGVSWTSYAAIPQTVAGGVSPDLLKLFNGNDVLLTYCDRSTTRAIDALISSDFGTTWLNATVVYSDTVGASDAYGYPTADQMADGRVLVAYYYATGVANIANTGCSLLTTEGDYPRLTLTATFPIVESLTAADTVSVGPIFVETIAESCNALDTVSASSPGPAFTVTGTGRVGRRAA